MPTPGAFSGLNTDEVFLMRRINDLQTQIDSVRSRGVITMARGDFTVTDNGAIVVQSASGQKVVVNVTPAASQVSLYGQMPTWGPATIRMVELTGGQGQYDPASFVLSSAANANNDKATLTLDTVSPTFKSHSGTLNTDATVTPLGSSTNNSGGGGPVVSFGLGSQQMRFDGNSIAVSTAAGAGASMLNFGVGYLAALAPGFPTPSYIPIKASAFTVSSDEAVKTDIVEMPFDSVKAIQDAPAMHWRYRDEQAADDGGHVGPMAGALPEQITVTEADGSMSVDLLSLVGTLWDAVSKLTARIEALESAR